MECSHTGTQLKMSIIAIYTSKAINPPYFPLSDTRETAFVNAITAAGVTYQVTRAYTKGIIGDYALPNKKGAQQRKNYVGLNNITSNTIPNSKRGKQNNGRVQNRKQRLRGDGKAGSHKKPPPPPPPNPQLAKQIRDQWKWSGRDENVNVGFRKAREFLDARYRRRRSDIKTLVKLHNNRVGRLVSNDPRPYLKIHVSFYHIPLRMLI